MSDYNYDRDGKEYIGKLVHNSGEDYEFVIIAQNTKDKIILTDVNQESSKKLKHLKIKHNPETKSYYEKYKEDYLYLDFDFSWDYHSYYKSLEISLNTLKNSGLGKPNQPVDDDDASCLDSLLGEQTSISEDKLSQDADIQETITQKKEAIDNKIETLVENIRKVRPSYSPNEIKNIAICMYQSFLTVFSGDPGCGKTSICNIMAQAMGLRKSDEPNTSGRYVPVSVERGWTSKSDFIGFNNPMTQKLVINNDDLYNALIKQDTTNPTLILLDEANLSPMEYYWSDFMKVCDSNKEDDDPDSIIHLGGNEESGKDGKERDIPIKKTLHFVATINNDETTESLSPRLIDRSFVITLPSTEYNEESDKLSDFWETKNNNAEEPEEMDWTWKDIEEAFLVTDMKLGNEYEWEEEDEKVLIEIVKELRNLNNIVVSKRSQQAINNYYHVAKRRFGDEDGVDKSRIALDFAVAQKILPMINVYKVTENGSPLDDLMRLCDDNNLHHSSKILDRMIKQGNDEMSMGFYTFF